MPSALAYSFVLMPRSCCGLLLFHLCWSGWISCLLTHLLF